MEMANELPQDPDKSKQKKDLISHKTQEASKLEERAVGLPQERYTDLLEKADHKQREENEMIKNLSSDPQIAKLQKKTIKDTRRDKNALRKEAHCSMATDSGEEDENEEKNEDEDVVSKITYEPESMLVMEGGQIQHATAQQTQTQQNMTKS